MKYKSLLLSITLSSIAILALAICDSYAQAPSTTWTGQAGDNNWFNPQNWTNNVPDISTDASVNQGGTARIIGSGTTAYCRSLVLGQAGQNSGTVEVIGDSLMLPLAATTGNFPQDGTIYVGYQGRGTFRITSGGTVSSAYGYIAALGPSGSSRTGSNGAVAVDGPYSTWTLWGEDNGKRLYVGGLGIVDGGTGLLSITDGGVITVNSPLSSGTYPFDVGASGTLSVNNGTVQLFYDGGFVAGRTTTIHGTLAPESKSANFIGYLGFNQNASTVCNVTPSDVPNTYIEVSKSTQLDGRLAVTMTGAFTPGMRFTLLHATEGLHMPGLSNSAFSSVSINYSVCPTCAPSFTPVIQYDYNANKVYLYLDPL